MPLVIDQATGQVVDVPQTGLIGSEQALGQAQTGAIDLLQRVGDISFDEIRGATQQGLGRLDAAQAGVGTQIGQGVGGLQPFVSPGQQAQQQQAALSGALGPEAQAQAFTGFQESPGQAFLRERGERALLRNQAAVGGLGGGNVLAELQRQGIGEAAQAFQQQFQNLGSVTGTGLQAAGQVGQLRGQQAGLTAGLGQAGAGLLAQSGANLANVATGLGGQGAGIISGIGQQIATGRTRAGEQIAGAISGTSSSLANLQQQQGAGISDITGQAGTALANLLSGAGQQTAAGQQALATILANISTQQGSQVAGLPLLQTGTAPNITGDIGNILGGLGTFISNQPQTAQPTAATINTGQQFAGFA